MCVRYGTPAEFLCQNNEKIFLALKSSTRYENLPIEVDGCVEVRLHPRSAILTLVGEGIDGTSEIATRTLDALTGIPVTILSSSRSTLAISLLVPSMEYRESSGYCTANSSIRSTRPSSLNTKTPAYSPLNPL
jgi:aspartokinase